MREIRFCVDCNRLRQLTVHGRCEKCDSDAIATARVPRFAEKDVKELERIFALPAERSR